MVVITISIKYGAGGKTLYHKLGKTDYDDPLFYHLVLNMNKLALEEARQMVCSRFQSET